jgi:hypothetical protein
MAAITIFIPFLANVQNEELRYTLRSIERNARFEYNIVIVAPELPEWLNTKEITWIKSTTERAPFYPKAWDSIMKWRLLLHSKEVSNDILLCYDDTVFLSPVARKDLHELVALTDIAKQNIELINASATWKEHLRTTFAALCRNNMKTFSYETHIPRLFKKNKVEELIEKFGFKKRPYLLPTLYFNEYFAHKTPLLLLETPNQKIKTGIYTDEDFAKVDWENPARFLNWGELQWSPELEKKLSEIFPDTSKFEVSDQRLDWPL